MHRAYGQAVTTHACSRPYTVAKTFKAGKQEATAGYTEADTQMRRAANSTAAPRGHQRRRRNSLVNSREDLCDQESGVIEVCRVV